MENTPVASSPSAEKGLVVDSAMVVSAREEASKIGLEILRQGGNAFDAMVATEMALAVVYPYAGNLGGGGFMVYRLKNGDVGALDYREKAPLNASRTMYLDSLGNVVSEKAGLGVWQLEFRELLQEFLQYTKIWEPTTKNILAPVIALANNGFVVTKIRKKL